MRKGSLVVAVLLVAVCVTSTASASVSVWDSFRGGLTIGDPGSSAKWFYFGANGFVGDDGTAQTGPGGGLLVRSSGTNPTTGLPAFTKTVAQEQFSGLPGGFDHVKWLVYMNHFSSGGFPGFDAVPGKQLTCESTVAGQTFGTAANPFGAAVTNPADDLRLASVAMNVIDFDTFMVFDVFFTNERIYAFYEHLPFARSEFGGPYDRYAAFSYAIPIATRSPLKFDTVAVGYDKAAGVVSWYVDGRKRFSVDHIGYRIDRRFMLLDHGGTEESFSPNQLDCGMGMFTLLDGHGPLHEGLVQLSSVPGFYFNPEIGEPAPETFVDGTSSASSRLFGQGAAIEVRNASVGYK
jgi:Family of unknown function (DUF6081)